MLNVKKALTKIMERLHTDNVVSSSYSTGSFNVSANAAGYKDVTITAPTGYTPIAVTNLVSNSSAAIPTGWLFQTPTTVRIYVRNVTSSQVTQNVTFNVLWKLTV